jgi:hypothetical protein
MASEMMVKTRRTESVVSTEEMGDVMVERTLTKTRNPSISRKTSLVQASWIMTSCILDKTCRIWDKVSEKDGKERTSNLDLVS